MYIGLQGRVFGTRIVQDEDHCLTSFYNTTASAAESIPQRHTRMMCTYLSWVIIRHEFLLLVVVKLNRGNTGNVQLRQFSSHMPMRNQSLRPRNIFAVALARGRPTGQITTDHCQRLPGVLQSTKQLICFCDRILTSLKFGFPYPTPYTTALTLPVAT